MIMEQPLSTSEIDILKTMRIAIWTNHHTNQSFIDKRHWRQMNDGWRGIVTDVLEHMRRPDVIMVERAEALAAAVGAGNKSNESNS